MNSEVYSVERMCKVLNVSNSCFYCWVVYPDSPWVQRNSKLLDKIKQIHSARKSLYGSPRITAELQKRGDKVSRNYITRLMKIHGIRSVIKKKYVYHRKFKDQQSSKLEIFRYIEGFYNVRRWHSALGGKTPNQMEQFYMTKQTLVA